MVGKLSQPGCHTNTGTRTGRCLVKLDEIPDNNMQRRNGRFSSMPVMRGQVRKHEKKQKSGKRFLGRTSSLLQFSSNRVNPPAQDKKETCQLALRTFRRMRKAASSSRAAIQVLADMEKRYQSLVLRHCEVGHVPWLEVGDCFECRAELRLVGLHGPPVAGIHWMDIDSSDGNKISVALSIVLSGGYEDDLDEGERVTYTGEGGQNDRKQQCTDQKMEGGNNALRSSCYMKKSVRVIRRRPDSSIPGGALFSYDGLYQVVSWEETVGLSNFLIYKFKLVREGNQKPLRWQSPVSSPRKKVSRGFESPR